MALTAQLDSLEGISDDIRTHYREENGKFVFRQQHTQDLRRAYMCGKLKDEGDVLVLRVENYKERLASGEILQATGTQEKRFDVKSRSDRRLVVNVGGQTVVLNLT